MLQGHNGLFAVIKLPGRDVEQAQLLAFEDKRPNQPAKLVVIEVGREKTAPGGVFRVTPQLIPVPADAPNDFPVIMKMSRKQELLYMVSKMGYLYLFDLHSGKFICRVSISTDTIFLAVEHSASGGILGITARKGQVLHVALDEANLVHYIVAQLGDRQLAIEVHPLSISNFSNIVRLCYTVVI